MKLKLKSNNLQRILLTFSTILLILIPVSIFLGGHKSVQATIDNPRTSASDELLDSVLWKFGNGLPGTGATMQPRLVNLTSGGDNYIVVGTDGGLAMINLDGTINVNYITFGDVIDFEMIKDISLDSKSDIVLISYDQNHANVFAIASNNGSEIWKYSPNVEGIDATTFSTQDFISNTWDVQIIDDTTGDNIPEVAISSWYKIIVLNGKTGKELWINDKSFTNDVWKVKLLEDIDNNGYKTIITGSEDGKLCAFDTLTGTLHWTFNVPAIQIPAYGMGSILPTLQDVPSSVNDIKVIGDMNSDTIDDLLVVSDDGYVRVISGRLGIELDKYLVYNLTDVTTPVGNPTDSPYYSWQRIFQCSGARFIDIPDINNDGTEEIMVYVSDLDYQDPQVKKIFGEIINLNASAGMELITKVKSLNWSYNTFYDYSIPEIMNIESDIRVNFYMDYEWVDTWPPDYAGIYYYDIDDEDWKNSINIYNDGEESNGGGGDYNQQTNLKHYLLNVGDTDGDSIDDLFAITNDGRYLLVSCKNAEIKWVRTKKVGGSDLIEIEDLNGDSLNDFLITKTTDFEPSWRQSNSGCETWDEDIITEVFAIDAKTGEIIWSLNLPNPEYYEGLRDLLNLGDVNDDGIDDYAGWIIPSSLPTLVKNYLINLYGEDEVPSQNEWDETPEKVSRALLTPYTKIVVISGSNGTIFWNTSLLDFPYEFYRSYKYSGTYENPTGIDSGSYRIQNRINGVKDSTWNNWNNNWKVSTLDHANSVEIETGQSLSSIFDLSGEQNNNYTLRSYNASASSELIKIGKTLNSTAIGAMDSNDDSLWFVNSSISSGKHKIEIELTYNQSQNIQSNLENVVIDYLGCLIGSKVSLIQISLYDFSSSTWKKISTSSINSTSSTSMVINTDNIDDFTQGANYTAKIKLYAEHTSPFILTIDKLIINYTYTYRNFTIESADIGGGKYQTLLNLTIPIGLSDEKYLGVMEYGFSQIDRLSALKMQSSITVNTSISTDWYNFTYEIYNFSASAWILCNFSNGNFWDKSIYPDLHSNYKSTGESGDRSDFQSFNFGQDSYKSDHMYVITRGTEDAESYLEFDYENATTLSDFVDSNKEIKIRLNITNGIIPFNLTIDNFGIGAFYWGLYNNRYDKNYIWDYQDSGDNKYTSENLLDLNVQDFKVINGTDDKYLNVIAIIGTGEQCSITPRIRLFDVKNKTTYTKWTNNRTYIPKSTLSAVPVNNSLNCWILSGIFNSPAGENYSHQLIDNPNWLTQLNFFDNYSDSTTSIAFKWNISADTDKLYSYGTFYEIPKKVITNNAGNVGLVLGLYDDSNNLEHLRVVDIKTKGTLSIIPADDLIQFSQQSSCGQKSYDFSSEGSGYYLLLSNEDLDADGALDHIGIYEGEQGDDWRPSYEIRVYSGASGGAGESLLFKKLYVGMAYGSSSQNVEFSMPLVSVGDLNKDGASDLWIGIQIEASSYGSYCKASYLNCFDIASSTATAVVELTDKSWTIESLSCLSTWYSNPNWQFYGSIESINDFNGDGLSEVLIGHYDYRKTTSMYGGDSYSGNVISEIVDLYNKTTLCRFSIDVDSIYPIKDLNGDGYNEFILISGELLFCVDSRFKVHISNPENHQAVTSNNFMIMWETNATYDCFEIFVNGTSQGYSYHNNISVSLGAGIQELMVLMYDKSGLVTAIDTISVTVPANMTFTLLTYVLVAAAIAPYIAINRLNKKKKGRVLIDRKSSEGGKK